MGALADRAGSVLKAFDESKHPRGPDGRWVEAVSALARFSTIPGGPNVPPEVKTKKVDTEGGPFGVLTRAEVKVRETGDVIGHIGTYHSEGSQVMGRGGSRIAVGRTGVGKRWWVATKGRPTRKASSRIRSKKEALRQLGQEVQREEEMKARYRQMSDYDLERAHDQSFRLMDSGTGNHIRSFNDAEQQTRLRTTYVPQGRTDQASYDYTDDPRNLAASFTLEQLKEALQDGMLKFDFEEHVPLEAIREAIRLKRRR